MNIEKNCNIILKKKGVTTMKIPKFEVLDEKVTVMGGCGSGCNQNNNTVK